MIPALSGDAVLTILAMAAVTIATRLGGLLLLPLTTLGGRARAAFDALPVAVLAALVGPTALAGSWTETVATIVAFLAALRLPIWAVVILGTATIAALRTLTA
ncbi:AzlD domain-containing protein [Segnochrobactraceae bacterium EtOH-i3]